MITQQVVTYIKDQLARGTDRTKIRTNLISAGWVESDINQAFSFAEPAGQSAAVKIAPAFAIEEEMKPKIPVDKTEINLDPVMPVLQKDSEKKEPSNLSAFAYGEPAQMPVQNTPKEPALKQQAPEASNDIVMPTLQTQPEVASPKIEASLNNIVKTPLSTSPMLSSIPASSPIKNTIETDVVRNFESASGPAMNSVVKKSGSPVLKVIAFLLFLVLILGNAYMWFVVWPGMQVVNMDTSNNSMNNSMQSERTANTEIENVVATAETSNQIVMNPVSNELAIPASSLLSSAANYFTQFNSYGSVNMSLGSCAVSGTVFSNMDVKKSIEDMSRITGRVPQCALSTDASSTVANRTTNYLVYIPMEDGGYCVDSTGASLMVSKSPTGTSCATGL